MWKLLNSKCEFTLKKSYCIAALQNRTWSLHIEDNETSIIIPNLSSNSQLQKHDQPTVSMWLASKTVFFFKETLKTNVLFFFTAFWLFVVKFFFFFFYYLKLILVVANELVDYVDVSQWHGAENIVEKSRTRNKKSKHHPNIYYGFNYSLSAFWFTYQIKSINIEREKNISN